MTGLTDDLTAALEMAPRSGGCSVCQILPALNPDERDALTAAFASKMGYKAIGRILRQNGHAAVDEHARLHRNERHGQ